MTFADILFRTILALVIPGALLCALGAIEWLCDRETEQPAPWEKRCKHSPECVHEHGHAGLCDEQEYE